MKERTFETIAMPKRTIVAMIVPLSYTEYIQVLCRKSY